MNTEKMMRSAIEYGMNLEGAPVAYEFYNTATGHAVVDYTRWTHVGHLREEDGYVARPLVYGSGERLTDEECDKAAAQAMDRVAAKRGMHALDLNPDVTAHHTLRRELIRAGYALARCGNDAETDAELKEKRP